MFKFFNSNFNNSNQTNSSEIVDANHKKNSNNFCVNCLSIFFKFKFHKSAKDSSANSNQFSENSNYSSDVRHSFANQTQGEIVIDNSSNQVDNKLIIGDNENTKTIAYEHPIENSNLFDLRVTEIEETLIAPSQYNPRLERINLSAITEETDQDLQSSRVLSSPERLFASLNLQSISSSLIFDELDPENIDYYQSINPSSHLNIGNLSKLKDINQLPKIKKRRNLNKLQPDNDSDTLSLGLGDFFQSALEATTEGISEFFSLQKTSNNQAMQR